MMNTETLEGECSSSSVPTSTDADANQSDLTTTDATLKPTSNSQTSVQPSSSGVNNETAPKPVQTNLQRIKQQKQDVYNWPKNKKLLKLAMYSSCQVCFKYFFHLAQNYRLALATFNNFVLLNKYSLIFINIIETIDKKNFVLSNRLKVVNAMDGKHHLNTT